MDEISERRPLTVGEMLINQRNAWAARALDLEVEVTMLRQQIAALEAADKARASAT